MNGQIKEYERDAMFEWMDGWMDEWRTLVIMNSRGRGV
jgi:hypothetical protein